MINNKLDKENEPDVSIIIAVYEHPDFLEKIFISLSNQTTTSFEIVIADDGSGPDVQKVIQSYSNRFKYPIKHVWHEKNGFRKTIIVNKAVAESTAEYLIFIDGDCIVHHRFIEFHLKRKEPSILLVGRRAMLSEKLSKMLTNYDIINRRIEKIIFLILYNNFSNIKNGLFIPGMFFLRNSLYYKQYRLIGCNFSVYKNDYYKINGYDERIIGRGLEDDNLYARFLLAGIKPKSMVHEAIQYHLFHTFDPAPHSNEIINMFKNPAHYWTEYGILKSSVNK